MVMLFDAFIASFFFFPVLIVAFVLLWGCVENEALGWSVIVSIVFGGMLYFKFPVVSEFCSHPSNIIMLVGAYIILGMTWGFTKWMLTLRKVRAKFIAFRDSYLAEHKFTTGYFNATNSPDKKEVMSFTWAVCDRFNLGGMHREGKSLEEVILAIRPLAIRHKSSIILWIAYWPLSIIWFVLSDMLSEIAETIYTAVAATFQKISDRMFSNLL